MDLSLAFFLIAVPGVLLAGISKGGFGAGAAFIATPLMALLIGPLEAAAVMLPILVVMDAIGIAVWWRQWSAEALRSLMAACVIGLALGTGLLIGLQSWGGQATTQAVLKLMIGGLSLGFAAIQVLGLADRPPLAPGGPRALIYGSAVGLTSFFIHAGGPAASLYLLPLKLAKSVFQASTVLLFALVNVAKVPLYGGLGLFTQQTLLASLILLPLAPVGYWMGVWAHKRVTGRTYTRIILALLAATGVKLIWDGVAALA